MAIITTAQYKTYAGITDAGFDTRLAVLIPAMQAMLEDYCGRVFDEATYADEVFDGNGEASLWLSNTPVTAMTAVKTKSSDGTTTTLDSTSYRFRANGELYLFNDSSNRWDYPDGWGFSADHRTVWSDDAPGNILISYTGGYSTMPVGLEYLMYTLVDAAIDRAGDSWMNASTSDGVESKATLNPIDLEKRYADLVRPWKRVMG